MGRRCYLNDFLPNWRRSVKSMSCIESVLTSGILTAGLGARDTRFSFYKNQTIKPTQEKSEYIKR